jgi:hypothetical protein
MKKSKRKIVCQDLTVVREVVAGTGIAGEWFEGENHCQFCTTTGAVLNYWKSTGTITFQGPELAAAELKAAFMRHHCGQVAVSDEGRRGVWWDQG